MAINTDRVWGIDRYDKVVSPQRGKLMVAEIIMYTTPSLAYISGSIPHGTIVTVLKRQDRGHGKKVYKVTASFKGQERTGWVLGALMKKRGLREPGITKLTAKEKRYVRNEHKNEQGNNKPNHS